MQNTPTRALTALALILPALLALLVLAGAGRQTKPGSPIVIEQPGLFVLDRSIRAADGPGIIVRSGGVTVDLGGHAIVCEVQRGIVVERGVEGVAIRNGSIVSPTVGIDGGHADMVTVRNVRVERASDAGVLLGTGATVAGVHVWRSAGDGVVLGSRSRAADSTIVACAGNGLKIGAGGVLSGIVSANNGGVGIDLGRGSTLSDSSAVSNVRGGVLASYACVLAQVAAESNGGHGIVVDDGSTITRCAAGDNAGDGVRGGAGVAIDTLSLRTNSGRGLVLGASGRAAGVVSTNNGSPDAWSDAPGSGVQ